MNKFMDWLKNDAKGWQIVGYVVFAALITVSLDFSVENALINWGLVPKPPLPEPTDTPFAYYNAYIFISMFIWGPIKEEVIFRVLPLSIVIAFISTSPKFVFPAATVFAILFGAIHPYSTVVKIDVAISGFFFGLVFLKCGGMNKAFVKASIAAMAAHGLANALIVLDTWWRFFELTK
ncbi:MAG: lysostaphin resistance A-like protein [Acidobacteriaceae bacterium]